MLANLAITRCTLSAQSTANARPILVVDTENVMMSLVLLFVLAMLVIIALTSPYVGFVLMVS
jgi:hypothetical protein